MGLCITKFGPEKKEKYDIYMVYTFGKEIGRGVMAIVYKAVHNITMEEVAIKVIQKKRLYPEEIEDVMTEVRVLKSLDHPNIVRIKEFVEDDENYYIIMELICGGELREQIIKKTVYTENEARKLCKNLISTVAYIHEKGIIHRDLKLDNLILCDSDDCENIKIVDFGVATDTSSMKKLCGTPWYIAPEILKRTDYTNGVDMWSIGVIIYMILCGRPPFNDKHENDLYNNIKHGIYLFQPTMIWEHISNEAKHLIQQLLVVDPAERLTAKEALQHPWMKMSDSVLATHHLEDIQDDLSSHCDSVRSHIGMFSPCGSIYSGCSRNNSLDPIKIRRTYTMLES